MKIFILRLMLSLLVVEVVGGLRLLRLTVLLTVLTAGDLMLLVVLWIVMNSGKRISHSSRVGSKSGKLSIYHISSLVVTNGISLRTHRRITVSIGLTVFSRVDIPVRHRSCRVGSCTMSTGMKSRIRAPKRTTCYRGRGVR